jgi:ureidoacrylate peracid hydrolase
VCCDTTAREAQARDLKVFFLSDGTATTGPDSAEVQRRTLTFVGALLGEVLTTAEMAERIIEARLSITAAPPAP